MCFLCTHILKHVPADAVSSGWALPGKGLVLLLTGKTVMPAEGALHLLFEHVYAKPVPIGLAEGVIQVPSPRGLHKCARAGMRCARFRRLS